MNKRSSIIIFLVFAFPLLIYIISIAALGYTSESNTTKKSPPVVESPIIASRNGPYRQILCSDGLENCSPTATEERPDLLEIFPKQATFEIHLPIVITSPQENVGTQSSFGTMLINTLPGDRITPVSVLIYANDRWGVKGLTSAGAPSELVRDEWFSKLPGWTRSFIRGTYADLLHIHESATQFEMEDMYECFSYGPESAHQAGEEALDPLYWVPRAEALAEEAGKCLIYGPAVLDYERLATPLGEVQPRDELLAGLVTQVAPHVDIWMIQLAKYQLFVDGGRDQDGNPYTMDEMREWLRKWVAWIKTANPNAKVWTQLGIGRYDPIQKVCLPPQPPEYLVDYQEMLVEAGIAGVWVMPAQPCQNSDNPQDHEYYLQSLEVFQEAIGIISGQ